MSTIPLPAPPTKAEVPNVVEMINASKSAFGLFSALTSKKAAVAITYASLLYVIGYFALKIDVFASLWFFGLGTALLAIWVVSQALVDAAQMWAIGHATAVTRSDIEALERD